MRFGDSDYSNFALLMLACVLAMGIAGRAEAAGSPVLGVVTSTRPFSIGPVEEKPETGPMIVVEGDEIRAQSAPVAFRMTGENRAILGNDSMTDIRPIPPQRNPATENGEFFYLRKGSLQYDARKEPLAICARDRLYVPSIPGSGEVVIVDNKPQVKLITGTMVRSGEDVCNTKGAAYLLSNIPGAPVALAANPVGTAIATAGSAGIQAGIPAAVTIGVSTATAGAVIGTTVLSQPPSSASPTTPAP